MNTELQVSVCVCVCVREREREREYMFVHLYTVVWLSVLCFDGASFSSIVRLEIGWWWQEAEQVY